MLGLLNTVLSKGNTLLTYVKDGLVMANRFLTPPKLTFPVDASAEFNGTSDYIDTGIANESWPSVYSVSFWANVKSGSIDSMPFTIGNGFAQNGFFFQYRASTNAWEIWFTNNGGTASSIQISNTAFENEWAFISMTYSGSQIKLYKDGSLIGSANTTIKYPTTYSAQIGRYLNGASGYWWNGNLANVAIWNRALSSDEINSVMWKTYEQVSTTESNGLQAWYKLSADEVISGDSTATLTTYANANALTFEAPACVQTALNGLPDITDARLYSANYDIRVKADGGTVESLSCVETELNAIL
jgi:hypothetical protein